MTMERIELDFPGEPPDLFCPVCGRKLFSFGCRQESCDHLLFWASSDGNRWGWLRETEEQRFEQLIGERYQDACTRGYPGSREEFDRRLSLAAIMETAARTVQRKSVFLLSLSTSDIGCGGMHNGTICALIDFQPTGTRVCCISIS